MRRRAAATLVWPAQRTRVVARLRSAAITWGAAAVHTWERSSSRLTSFTQCTWFSIFQCSRRVCNRRSAPATVGARLVTAKLTSTCVRPFTVRRRSIRHTCRKWGHSSPTSPALPTYRFNSGSAKAHSSRRSRRPWRCFGDSSTYTLRVDPRFRHSRACQKGTAGPLSPSVSSGGKGVRQVPVQCGLVLFHRQQVVPATAHYLLTHLPLRQQGVRHNYLSLQGHLTQHRLGAANS